MASEYQLNLKAVLDSTQVQEELNKLRQSTSQALGGENAPSNVQAPSGNLTNLGSTLNNLNQTLNRLNQILGQLRPNLTTPRQDGRYPSTNIPPIALTPFTAEQIKTIKNGLEGYEQFKNAMADIPKQRKLSPLERQVMHASYGMMPEDLPYNLMFGTGQKYKYATRFVADLFGSRKNLDKLNNFRNNLKKLGVYDQPEAAREAYTHGIVSQIDRQNKTTIETNESNRRYNRQLARSMKLFAGQYVAGELNNIGESIGGRTGAIISSGVQGAQSGLMTGAMMYMAGMNPITVAAAGIATAAAKISSVMLEYAQKLAQAGERSYALLSRSKAQIEEQYKTAENIRFSRDLRNKDAAELTQLRSRYETNTETAYSRYQTLVEGQQTQLQQARQEYLDKMNEASSTDEKTRIEQEYANAVANIVQSVGKAKEQWEESAKKQQEINAALEDIKREYKDRRSYRYYLDRRGAEGYSDVDVASRSSQWSQRANRIQEELNTEIAKNDMSEAGRQRRAQLQSLYSEYQSEADFWEKQSKSRESAVETVQKDILVQERIKEIENLTKQYDFSRDYSSVDNRREILADFEGQRLNIRGLYMQSQQNVFEFQNQMMEALRKAASAGISQEERTKTLEEAGTLEERIQHEKNKMGVFQQAYTQLGGLKVEELQDVLSKLEAPSKDRATSLAQYGYNMGEKNDDDQRWQSELQYLKDQKQLQDDIKTILNDKLPSPATFA